MENLKLGQVVWIFDEIPFGILPNGQVIAEFAPIPAVIYQIKKQIIQVQVKATRQWWECGPHHWVTYNQIIPFTFEPTINKWIRQGLTSFMLQDENGIWFNLPNTRQFLLFNNKH